MPATRTTTVRRHARRTPAPARNRSATSVGLTRGDAVLIMFGRYAQEGVVTGFGTMGGTQEPAVLVRLRQPAVGLEGITYSVVAVSPDFVHKSK